MAGHKNIHRREYLDAFETVVFGPFTEGDVSQTLPWFHDKDVVVDTIQVMAGTKPSVASNFTMYRRRGTTDADAAAAIAATTATQLTDTVDLNSVLTNLVPYDLSLYNPQVNFVSTPKNNLFEAGDQMVAAFGDLTDADEIYIHVRYRERFV